MTSTVSVIKRKFERTKRKFLSNVGTDRGAGATLKVFPSDRFIVSYPRSGNTWARFLLGSMLYDTDMDFMNVETLVPDIYLTTNRSLEAMSGPRYLKSHEPYDERYPKVLYLVRDPRDVALSYYHYQRKYRPDELADEQPFEHFIEQFLENDTRYAGWGNHVAGYLEHEASIPDGFLCLRYEDMLSDPVGRTMQIASFFELDLAEERAQEIVAANEFEKMAGKESEATRKVRHHRTSRADIRFVRQGRSGQWKEVLTESQVAAFADRFGPIMQRLGYLPAGSE